MYIKNMKEYYSIDLNKRTEMIKIITQCLLNEGRVVFAYVFGSFLKDPSFRDIDIGVYIKDYDEGGKAKIELELARKIAENIGMSFDNIEINVLNSAPYSFLANIFSRGRLLFSNDNELLPDLIEKSSLSALSNEYIAYQSLRELMAV